MGHAVTVRPAKSQNADWMILDGIVLKVLSCLDHGVNLGAECRRQPAGPRKLRTAGVAAAVVGSGRSPNIQILGAPWARLWTGRENVLNSLPIYVALNPPERVDRAKLLSRRVV